MTTARERDVERALVGMVKRHGGLCLKWVCPNVAGVPDRIILLPGGRVIFAEVKRPTGGRVAPLQDWWKKILTKLGFKCVYVYERSDIEWLEMKISNPPYRKS